MGRRTQVAKTTFILALLDLDKFKGINDGTAILSGIACC
jgi:GGDEF domain-containing protein